MQDYKRYDDTNFGYYLVSYLLNRFFIEYVASAIRIHKWRDELVYGTRPL